MNILKLFILFIIELNNTNWMGFIKIISDRLNNLLILIKYYRAEDNYSIKKSLNRTLLYLMIVNFDNKHVK